MRCGPDAASSALTSDPAGAATRQAIATAAEAISFCMSTCSKTALQALWIRLWSRLWKLPATYAGLVS